LLYPYSVPPDDGFQIRPKHVEVSDEKYWRLIVHQVSFSLNELVWIIFTYKTKLPSNVSFRLLS
jgi:hypothetical protein